MEANAETVTERVLEAVGAEGKAVVEEVKAAVVHITDAKKLAIREMENAFLKAHLELQKLQEGAKVQQGIISNAQQNFPALIKTYMKEAGLKEEEYLFDAIELVFKKK